MTKPREQAREAAMAAAHNDEIDAMHGADAASDVWEPIVRNLVDQIMEEVASGHLVDPRYQTWEAIDRAKEALDERP